MPKMSSVCGDWANHEHWCCPPLLAAERGSGLGHSQRRHRYRELPGKGGPQGKECCGYERLLQPGRSLHLQLTWWEELPGLSLLSYVF